MNHDRVKFSEPDLYAKLRYELHIPKNRIYDIVYGGDSETLDTTPLEHTIPEIHKVNNRIRDELAQLREKVNELNSLSLGRGLNAISNDTNGLCDLSELRKYIEMYAQVQDKLSKMKSAVDRVAQSNVKRQKFLVKFNDLMQTQVPTDRAPTCSDKSVWTHYAQNFTDLQEIYEDITGTMRIYINIFSRTDKPNVVPDRGNYVKAVPPCGTLSYGPFSNVFTQLSQYNEVVGSIVDSIVDNPDKTSILFSFGISGSGKTTTLFGPSDGSQPGVISQILALLYERDSTITMTMSVRELYGQIHPPNTIIQAPLMEYVSNTTVQSTQDIVNQMNQINQQRRATGRIKPTSNNPDSSRGFLIVEFKFMVQGAERTLMFIDAAGAENVFDLGRNMFHLYPEPMAKLSRDSLLMYLTHITRFMPEGPLSKVQSRTSGFWRPDQLAAPEYAILQKYLNSQGSLKFPDSAFTEYGGDKAIDVDQAFYKLMRSSLKIPDEMTPDQMTDWLWSLYGESLFVSEVLNHFSMYVIERTGKQLQLQKVSPIAGRFASASNASSPGYLPTRIFQTPQEAGPSFGLINSLGVNKNTMRFVALVSLRNDVCIGTLETLEFAKRLTSSVS